MLRGGKRAAAKEKARKQTGQTNEPLELQVFANKREPHTNGQLAPTGLSSCVSGGP